ncbi:hypothetical protein E2C01_065330 [Portunus trituberculatus]|uniref:Uncharacterized protein n=1 Tax=Portunus trituberculatus TaxID=210409 RepID=A0A5B7HIJ7_PORTR|nr:hypothetical protein [Portunus trituberculatus]
MTGGAGVGWVQGRGFLDKNHAESQIHNTDFDRPYRAMQGLHDISGAMHLFMVPAESCCAFMVM